MLHVGRHHVTNADMNIGKLETHVTASEARHVLPPKRTEMPAVDVGSSAVTHTPEAQPTDRHSRVGNRNSVDASQLNNATVRKSSVEVSNDPPSIVFSDCVTGVTNLSANSRHRTFETKDSLRSEMSNVGSGVLQVFPNYRDLDFRPGTIIQQPRSSKRP